MSNTKKDMPNLGVPGYEEPAQKEPSTFDRIALGLASGVAAFGELARDAVHQGTQEFVTTALGLDRGTPSAEPAEKDPEPEPDRDAGRDR